MMNQNHLFACLNIGLPEDILRLKMNGNFERAVQLIDARLEKGLTEPLANCMRAEREIMLRLPGEYPYTKKQALALVQKEIPDFTEQELDALVRAGRIDWIFLEGQERFLSSFFATLKKTDAGIALRAGLNAQAAGEEQLLDRSLRLIQTNGSFGCRIRLRASVRIADEAFRPGKKVRVWLPVPAVCRQQSNIKILSSSPEITFLAPEDAPQRTAYFEEVMQENHPFAVEYEYDSTIHRARPGSAEDAPAPEDFAEHAPHILFTPYLRQLCKTLCQGKKTDLEKAQSFYDFITTSVKYAYVREYFGLTSIAEHCAKSLSGDCGVQAVLFITLCRCAGIAARWQSGLCARPGYAGPHDWAEFYAQPFGWLYADPSFGGGANRVGDERRRRFYFGGLDPYRMVANRAFYADFQPPSQGFRADPYDSQSGEIEVEGRGLRYEEYERTRELLTLEELPL